MRLLSQFRDNRSLRLFQLLRPPLRLPARKTPTPISVIPPKFAKIEFASK
jgi:hypothetical protein